MKRMNLMLCALLSAGVAMSQGPTPAAPGVTYGAGTSAEGTVVPVTELEGRVSGSGFSGKVSGKVVDVCKEKGCWMKLARTEGEPVMVKFKDYGFFMPGNIVGREVVLEGTASVKEVSVKQRQHYARDAGKPEEEVRQIREPKRELQFVAAGVLVR